MVSITFIFTIALVLVYTILITNNSTTKISKDPLAQFIVTHSNPGWLILLTCILLTVNDSFLIVTFLGLVITYFQPYVWVSVAETTILYLKRSIRDGTIERLIKDNLTITHWNVHLYIYDFLKSEALMFKEVFELSVLEILIACGFNKPSSESNETASLIAKIYKRLFKYYKIDMSKESAKLDPKNYKKFINSPFKRKLPWKFSYTESPDVYFELYVKNIIIIYNFVKTTVIALTLSFIYFIYTVFFFKLQFLKQLAVWFVICMLYFWLMSGFNFFLKRYQFGKFTAQIQRFWKRTNICFWLIEGFLILILFYYYLNSSQEPSYMYDYSGLNQEYLVSLHSAGINIILLSLVIYFMYFTMLRINSNSWNQLSVYLILISSFIFFSFFLETYQFFYVISTFNERLWVFNEEENLWLIEIDNPILRTKHQYLLMCLIAKYWHFLFIFLSWVFFLVKSFEKKKITFVMFGVNLQNIVLLYVLNLACYIQWFKWLYRKFFDLPYNWFMVSIDNKFFFRLFLEVKLLISNLFSVNIANYSYSNVIYKSLTLWNVDSLCIWKFL